MQTKVKVLHFSTHNEDCGIGKYQEMFLAAMQPNEAVENKFFDVSPNQIRIMSAADKANVFQILKDELKAYDALHVQHEFSFYPSDEFLLACDAAKETGKKLIVTIHTSPVVAYEKARRVGYMPRNVLHYLRLRKKEEFFTRTFAKPLMQADLVLVHNNNTRNALIAIGIDGAKIGEINIPVPEVDFSYRSDEIAQKLQKKKGDVVFATTGFLHKFKGLDHAVKSLSYLPAHYKLAIIGGMHRDHDNQIYNDLCDMIRDLGLMDRVYITGYVADDDRLNALIRECDLCVYPYEKNYYANVSSAALNNAFANHKPVVAYPTASFGQINSGEKYMVLTQAFSYYELAREIGKIDLEYFSKKSIEYSSACSYPAVAKELVAIYTTVCGGKQIR